LADAIVCAADHAAVTCYSTTFQDAENSGLSADNHSTIIAQGCTFNNIKRFPIVLTGTSTGRISACTFVNLSRPVALGTECTVHLTDSTFDGSSLRAIEAIESRELICDNCEFRNCEYGLLYGDQCDRVHIKNCAIDHCAYSAIFLHQCRAKIRDCFFAHCDGNGVNCARCSSVRIKNCHIFDTAYPPICLCDSTSASVKTTVAVRSAMSGIVVRTGSTARLRNCDILASSQFGICVSDLSTLTMRNCFIGGSAIGAMSCYNHSTVNARLCHLVGPTAVGVDVFTGGYVEMKKTTIAGMTDVPLWIHLAGAGYFEKMVFVPGPIDPSLTTAAIVADLAARPRVFPGRDAVVRAETRRAVRISFDSLRHVMSLHRGVARAEPGRDATHPVCKVCASDASEWVFSPCAHAIYCRACWEALEVKPTACELCFLPIDTVVRPRDCSRQETGVGECGICYAAPADSLVMPCGHAICLECGTEWLKEHSTCPFCRSQNASVKKTVSYQ
jgi:hypothetical protein